MTTGTNSHEFFSLGALVGRVWQPTYLLLPWAFTSALLTVAAMWDYWRQGGAIDYVVLGLAAYELMIGLLEESAPEPQRYPRHVPSSTGCRKTS
jgi:hypothetical protein